MIGLFNLRHTSIINGIIYKLKLAYTLVPYLKQNIYKNTDVYK